MGQGLENGELAEDMVQGQKPKPGSEGKMWSELRVKGTIIETLRQTE